MRARSWLHGWLWALALSAVLAGFAGRASAQTVTCDAACTVTYVVSVDHGTATLAVSDAETRSMLIAAFCVSIVALGFIGGNLS